MIEKIVNGISWGLVGIDGLIILWFAVLVIAFIGDEHLNKHGEIMERLEHQNDPDYWNRKKNRAMKIGTLMIKTLIFGGLFIFASFWILFILHLVILPEHP